MHVNILEQDLKGKGKRKRKDFVLEDRYYSVLNVNFSIKEPSSHMNVCLFVLLSHSGYKPYAVTHASDQFQLLYDLAVDLIRR